MINYLTFLVEKKIENIIEELNTIDRAYFGKDRPKMIKAKIDEAIGLLDTRPIDQGKFRAINYFTE